MALSWRGAGILVIETLDHALARGAVPIAEIVGYGTSADAYHMTSGPEDGSGAAHAMRRAIRQAGISPDDIQHLNAHSTSTPVGDRGEIAAIQAVFGARSDLANSAPSRRRAICWARPVAVEAIFTLLAIRDQVAPATLNLVDPDPLAAGLNLVRGAPLKTRIDYAISNGFGFGGVNASVLFRRLD